MNKEFEKGIKKKDSNQGKMFLYCFLSVVAMGVFIFLGLNTLAVLSFIMIFFFFILAAFTGRSISDDIAYKIAKSQEKDDKDKPNEIQ